MSLGERIRLLFRLFMLFTFLVVVALISAITTIRLTIHGHQESMPKLVGVPAASAQRIASSLGLELKIEDRVYSTKYPTNAVVSQMPPQGTPIKVGQHVHVLVSLGPPAVTVPNLVGGSLRAARITAIQRGLTVGDVAEVYWPGTEPDQVILQEPPPATTEVHSPAVNLLVSLGGPPPAYLCPNLIGRPLEQARHAVENAGFRVGSVASISTDAAAKGTILAQSPLPGSKINSDTVFSFQVAEPGAPSPSP